MKPTNKVCKCCNTIQKEIPANARFSDDRALGGWYWECACGSTMFEPSHSKEEIEAFLMSEDQAA